MTTTTEPILTPDQVPIDLSRPASPRSPPTRIPIHASRTYLPLMSPTGSYQETSSIPILGSQPRSRSRAQTRSRPHPERTSSSPLHRVGARQIDSGVERKEPVRSLINARRPGSPYSSEGRGLGRKSAQGQVGRPMRILGQGNASRLSGAGMNDSHNDKETGFELSSSNPRKLFIPRSFDSRQRDSPRQGGLGERILRTTASPRPELPRSITSPANVSTPSDLLSRVTTQTSVDSVATASTTGTQSPRRGRTRTVVPIVHRGWGLNEERLPQVLAQSDSVVIDLSSPVSKTFTEDLGVGVGGHKLGVRQPERQLPTPCASPPKRAVHPAPLPIPARYASQEEKRASYEASPRDAGTPTRTKRTMIGRSSLDMVENQVPEATVPTTAAEEKTDQDIETIEEALNDAMETSLELLAIEEPDAYPFEPISHDDTVRSKGKRKNQEDEHQTEYPEKKGKTAEVARKTLPEEFQRGRDRTPVHHPGTHQEKPLRRPLSLMAHRDSTSTVAVSANVHASAEIVSRPISVHTVHSPVAIRRRPSIDHLINALEMVADARTVSASAGPRSKVDRRRTMPSVMRALEVGDGAERKGRPTLVKQATEVVTVAQNAVATGDISVGTVLQPPDAAPISRTASISLKRIQDNDMERVMHAYQTRSRSHSPASQLEAAYRAHEASSATDTGGVSWETLHRRNVLDRARNVEADWKRGKDRAGTLASFWPSTKGSLGSPSVSTGRPGLLNRSVSYAPDSPSHSKAQAESSLKAARRQSGGEVTMMHTRWDGTKTPITEKDHPAHYAALKEHRLVRQRSKQSVLDDEPSSHSPTQSSAFAKNQDLGRAHTASAAPPVSIERWRQHLSQASGAYMPPFKTQKGTTSPGEEMQRPDFRHARTLPLPLDTACLSRSPTMTISGHSQDGNLPMSACSGSSFNAVKAYDKVKSETGLISFDHIPGLNGSESASQRSSNED